MTATKTIKAKTRLLAGGVWNTAFGGRVRGVAFALIVAAMLIPASPGAAQDVVDCTANPEEICDADLGLGTVTVIWDAGNHLAGDAHMYGDVDPYAEVEPKDLDAHTGLTEEVRFMIETKWNARLGRYTDCTGETLDCARTVYQMGFGQYDGVDDEAEVNCADSGCPQHPDTGVNYGKSGKLQHTTDYHPTNFPGGKNFYATLWTEYHRCRGTDPYCESSPDSEYASGTARVAVGNLL